MNSGNARISFSSLAAMTSAGTSVELIRRGEPRWRPGRGGYGAGVWPTPSMGPGRPRPSNRRSRPVRGLLQNTILCVTGSSMRPGPPKPEGLVLSRHSGKDGACCARSSPRDTSARLCRFMRPLLHLFPVLPLAAGFQPPFFFPDRGPSWVLASLSIFLVHDMVDGRIRLD